MKKALICIGCPLGCSLSVELVGKKIQRINGNRCEVGLEYAEKEVSNPERILTTTVRVKNGHLPLVSVRTNKQISKNRIFKVMVLLAKIEVEAPIRIGDEIIPDLFDTNVSIVATKNILKIDSQSKL